MADGFLGRWSRRKIDVKEGKPLQEPAAPSPLKASVAPGSVGSLPSAAVSPASQPSVVNSANDQAPLEPPPTLDDTVKLTPASDFKPYMSAQVAPEVRNAAMKKLFADPHFNIMDGLDIYIDDYGKPDPLPMSMMRQMASAKFLGLFDDEDKKSAAAKKDALVLPPGNDAEPAQAASPEPSSLEAHDARVPEASQVQVQALSQDPLSETLAPDVDVNRPQGDHLLPPQPGDSVA